MDEPFVESASGLPNPALAGVVDRYLGYHVAGFPPGLHWGVPSSRPTFIVSIGDPIDVAVQSDPRQAPASYGAVLGGLQPNAARIAHNGTTMGVTIELTPLGFRTLFAMPVAALWNASVELDDALGPLGHELWERLQGEPTWPARFAACDHVLGRRMARRAARQADVAPELRHAWTLTQAGGGAAGVAGIAEVVGWSRQHLTRRFTDEFGLGPKLAGRIARFERAHRMLTRTPSFVSIAQVAAVCGFYDQAHLDREYQAFAGASPSRLLAEDLPSVQAEGTLVGGR